MEIREGGVTIRVPALATEGTTDGVFYNPRQERNRDVTVATLRAFRDRDSNADSYVDAMTATGIRGVRAAQDGWNVTCCDRNPAAVDLATDNLAANDLQAEVVRADANVLLHERDFDIVDLDPFGSPIGFLDAAFARPRRLVCVTATDTAPLCGAHFRSGIRRYGAIPRNTEYHREMGLRVLLSAICRTAARYDVAINPLLSHTEGHYVRTYLALDEGATVADAAIDRLGTLMHCNTCLHRETAYGLLPTTTDSCASCGGSNVVTAGPIWLDRPHDPAFVRSVRSHFDDAMQTADRASQMLEMIAGEIDQPSHYDHHVLCKQWNRPAASIADVLDALEAAGFAASRAHYAGTAFKTDATVAEIQNVTSS